MAQVKVRGTNWKVDVDGQRIGKPTSQLWSFKKVDGKWRSFDGTGFGLSVRVGTKILLDTIMAEARKATVAGGGGVR